MICWRDDFRDPGAGVAVVTLALGEDDFPPTPRDLAEAPPRDPMRAGFLRRRAATRRAVAARLGVSPQRVDIGHAASGAPLLLAPKSPLEISVSGRENFCAVAMAPSPIGVDIEPLRDMEPPWSLLHRGERDALANFRGAARRDAFLRLWTAKEAYLKALGLGFSREPAEFAIGLDFTIFDEKAAPAVAARGWRRLDLNGEAFIAACVVLCR